MVDDSFHDAWKGMNKQNLQHRKTVLSRTGRRVIRQLISSCYHCQTDHTLQKQHKLSWGCLDETPTKDIVDDTIDNALNGMKKTEIVSLVAEFFRWRGCCSRRNWKKNVMTWYEIICTFARSFALKNEVYISVMRSVLDILYAVSVSD